ncbi:MAG TPA: PilN domain-containing protein [Candidatus Limnocylindrales bacterium]|nr:PilN domain-containing protein [Candidatus Limnocylindrales bacterium]
MINLLPDTLKDQYMYGRRNFTLRRWAIALSCGLLGSVLIALAGMAYLQMSIDSYSQKVGSTEQALKAQKLVETQKRSEEITNNLKLVVNVLSKEVLFSQLLKQIGSVTPQNVNLTDLSISEVAGGIELAAVSADYTSATQLQVNLEDPHNKIFSKADILNISCASGSASDRRYPCTLRIRALFAEDNPFLFINQKAVRP